MDAFAFEFMGLVMIALCLAVLAVPSGRRPSRRVRYYWAIAETAVSVSPSGGPRRAAAAPKIQGL